MSDYERHAGTIEKVQCNDLEEFAKNLVGVLPKYCDNYIEYLRDNWEDYGYYIHNNELYRIIDNYQEHSDDIFNYEIKDNKIEYLFSFYNGGTCLAERIDEVLDKVNLKITKQNELDELEWKEDIEEVSYSDDFWYVLTNGYIDLDELLVDNPAKEKLKEAIRILEDFESELTSQDFFVEM